MTPEQIDPRVSAFLAGDEQAGRGLLLELLPRVRNVVRSLLGRDNEVDDISQQVMVEVIRGLGTFRGTGSLQGWTDRITVRVALTHARKKRLRAQTELSSDDQSRNEAPDPRRIEASRYVARRTLVGWLDQLPIEQRNAIVMHHVLGLTVTELSQELGASSETIRSRIRLGMGKLRRWSAEPKKAAP